MSTPFPGFSSPAASTEVPLEMLAACHDRITRQCATLRRLVPHLAQHGADEQARTAAANVMRYFDTSAVHHHQDEEADLFPALIESMAGSDPVCLRELTAALTADHRELERRWRALKRPLDALVAGRAAALDAAEVEAFVGLYARHIEREEAELLPMAERLIGAAELDRIGRAMRERRGV
ncbi:MAG: hemerythrin domain-containing protein [Burkholderiales bacterium]|nr:hemerythrin domain-containing protein [Burkholderiales bacterium]